MGLAGYYTRFLEGFSQISNPITTLQKKGSKFEWENECEEGFVEIKQFSTISPILRVPNMDKHFCMH
jgi:hypothetical protein